MTYLASKKLPPSGLPVLVWWKRCRRPQWVVMQLERSPDFPDYWCDEHGSALDRPETGNVVAWQYLPPDFREEFVDAPTSIEYFLSATEFRPNTRDDDCPPPK